MPSLVYLVIYLCLHACAARPLSIPDSVSQIQMSIRRPIEFGNQITSAVEATDSMKGSPSVKVSCSRKILQEAAARKAGKISERATPESPPSNGEETVNSKEIRTPEDVVVMDYEQPHRKPPIHNWEP